MNIRKLFILPIILYQKTLSPFFPSSCRFTPTCSEYSKQSILKYGLFKGSYLGVKRILKCHPFKKLGGGHGLDFVPIPKNKKGSNNG